MLTLQFAVNLPGIKAPTPASGSGGHGGRTIRHGDGSGTLGGGQALFIKLLVFEFSKFVIQYPDS